MIPHYYADYTETYAYPMGFRNVAFMLAEVIEFRPDERVLYVHRGNPQRPIPIHLTPDTSLGRWVKKGAQVDLILRIFSEHDDDGKLRPTVRLVLKHLSEPRLISLTFDDDFDESAVKEDRLIEMFGSVDTDQFSKSSIIAQICGWSDQYMRVDSPDGAPRLVVFIRQSENDKYLIPVVLVGKHIKTYQKILKSKGLLNYISTKSLIVPVTADDGRPTVELRTRHIELAVKDKDYRLNDMPDWVRRALTIRQAAIAERMAKAKAKAEAESRAKALAETL